MSTMSKYIGLSIMSLAVANVMAGEMGIEEKVWSQFPKEQKTLVRDYIAALQNAVTKDNPLGNQGLQEAQKAIQQEMDALPTRLEGQGGMTKRINLERITLKAMVNTLMGADTAFERNESGYLGKMITIFTRSPFMGNIFESFFNEVSKDTKLTPEQQAVVEVIKISNKCKVSGSPVDKGFFNVVSKTLGSIMNSNEALYKSCVNAVLDAVVSPNVSGNDQSDETQSSNLKNFLTTMKDSFPKRAVLQTKKWFNLSGKIRKWTLNFKMWKLKRLAKNSKSDNSTRYAAVYDLMDNTSTELQSPEQRGQVLRYIGQLLSYNNTEKPVLGEPQRLFVALMDRYNLTAFDIQREIIDGALQETEQSKKFADYCQDALVKLVKSNIGRQRNFVFSETPVDPVDLLGDLKPKTREDDDTKGSASSDAPAQRKGPNKGSLLGNSSSKINPTTPGRMTDEQLEKERAAKERALDQALEANKHGLTTIPEEEEGKRE